MTREGNLSAWRVAFVGPDVNKKNGALPIIEVFRAIAVYPRAHTRKKSRDPLQGIRGTPGVLIMDRRNKPRGIGTIFQLIIRKAVGEVK